MLKEVNLLEPSSNCILTERSGRNGLKNVGKFWTESSQSFGSNSTAVPEECVLNCIIYKNLHSHVAKVGQTRGT